VASLAELEASPDVLSLLTNDQKWVLENKDKILARKDRGVLEPLVDALLKNARNDGRRAEIAGSYRRGCPTVRDLDMVVVARDTASDFDQIARKRMDELLRGFEQMLDSKGERILLKGSKGGTRSTVWLSWKGGIVQLDVVYVPPSSEFTALQHLTGPRELNIQLARRAKTMGLRLGMMHLSNKGRNIKVHSEKFLFKLLRAPYTPPTERGAPVVCRIFQSEPLFW
jgi:DNA polymerase/3'-5' exonuclease PolX